MEGRKWEDMSTDCLVIIFNGVELVSLVFDIPYVCKSWYRASYNPLCWKLIVDPLTIQNTFGALFVDGLMKLMVVRSQRCATMLNLPEGATSEELLVCISNECPALKSLSLDSSLSSEKINIFPSLIQNWTCREVKD